ncbi:fimbrial protein [Erwinia billingiae]|uniref:fimbrial protein n=1 Tax=Erwinia billingiae TaxID=182337 RepID=UPI003209D9C2
MMISLLPVEVHAHPASSVRGIITINGSIFDSPCAIDVADQTVKLETVTSDTVKPDLQGTSHPFALHIKNCREMPQENGQANASRFQVIFDGQPQDGLFALGGGSGIGLEIADNAGHIAVPGQPMPDESAIADRMELDYVLRLVGDRSRLKAGGYVTAIRFKADYF